MIAAISQYILSVENAMLFCRTLRDIDLVRDDNNKPICYVGNSAIVFKAKIEGKLRALRVYMRFHPNLRAIYRDQLYPRELFVCHEGNEELWADIVLCEWREGLSLQYEIMHSIADSERLQLLSQRFEGFAAWLLDQDWAHGDIKPENIMVLKNGYIKLIDFGTAKKITEDKAATIIGTPHYMAPEVILGDGYSFQVDFWSIAICMYEFMCGAVPFGENAEEPMDVYLAVINDPLQFPPYCKDRDFKHLMQLMLTKNQLSRYSKLGQISSHVWFQTFNWDDLISMNMHPAFIPSMGETKGKGKPVEFVDYVKQCKEWEPYDEPQDVTKEQKTIFDNWLEKF